MKKILVPLILLVLVGCDRGPKLHTVQGKLQLEGAEVADLSGSTIEAVSTNDPNVRASGEIKADGSFTLETLQGGTIRKGALEGEYKVRFILTDDDPATKRKAAKALAKRYLKTETANLTLQVPVKGDAIVAVSAR
jgi:hypothetical protein